MSHMETHIGKIIKVADGICEAVNYLICKEGYFALNPNTSTKEELSEFFYNNNLHYKFMFYGVTLYKIEDKEITDLDESKLEDDGSISYLIEFHNGGADLLEMLEEIVNKHKIN